MLLDKIIDKRVRSRLFLLRVRLLEHAQNRAASRTSIPWSYLRTHSESSFTFRRSQSSLHYLSGPKALKSTVLHSTREVN